MGIFARSRSCPPGSRLSPCCLLLCLAALLGAWPGEAEAQDRFIRGDSTGDGRVDITDPIHTLGYLFLGGPPPPCREAADSNDDAKVDIADPINTLQTLFLGSESIPPPYPLPGEDPTPDSLGCAALSPGLLLEVRLEEGFNAAPIIGVDLIFDSAPGGPPLDLTPLPGGGDAPFERTVISVDRDPEPELVFHFPGNPFVDGVLQALLPLGGVATAPASLQVNVLGAGGILASAIAFQLPDGEPSCSARPGAST